MKKLFLCLILIPGVAFAQQTKARSLGGTPRPQLTNTAYGSIAIRQSDGTGFCSGVLISPRHVLTAGHCSLARTGEEANAPSQYRLRIARGRYTVTQIDVNPGYNPDDEVGDASSKFDIGILTLDRAVTRVSPIQLGSTAVVEGESLFFFGYGTNAIGESDPLKRAARGKILVNRIGDGVFGAVRSPKNRYATSCPGDSGGAVVRGTGSAAVLVGAVSAGSTGTKKNGACKSNANPDDDVFVDLLSASSQSFINSVIN